MRIISRKEALEFGAVRFFTGEPCRHGHVCERFAGSGKCLQCHQDRARRLYLKAKLSDRATIERNRKQAERIRARQRQAVS